MKLRVVSCLAAELQCKVLQLGHSVLGRSVTNLAPTAACHPKGRGCSRLVWARLGGTCTGVWWGTAGPLRSFSLRGIEGAWRSGNHFLLAPKRVTP